jgi:hypothetical protein
MDTYNFIKADRGDIELLFRPTPGIQAQNDRVVYT